MANEITYKPVQISIFQKIAICYSFIVYGLNNVFGSNYEICKYFIYGLLVVLAAIVFLIQIKNISFKRIWVLLLFGIIGACIFPFIYCVRMSLLCFYRWAFWYSSSYFKRIWRRQIFSFFCNSFAFSCAIYRQKRIYIIFKNLSFVPSSFNFALCANGIWFYRI